MTDITPRSIAWRDFLHVAHVGRRAKDIDTYLIEETHND